MSDRAKRRRAMRAAGYRRAEGKRGRRPAIRTAGGAGEAYPALGAAGFTVEVKRLLTPKADR